MLTTSVIASSTSAAYISAVHLDRARLGEVEASSEASVLAGEKSDQADLVGVADQHRQRHRLAQRPAEAEHQRAEDAARPPSAPGPARIASHLVAPMP